MKWLKTILILTWSSTVVFVTRAADLTVTNNGPVIYGSNITFEAVLQDSYFNFSFEWVFEDNADPPTRSVFRGPSRVTHTKSYDKPGRYKMKVSASFIMFPVAKTTNIFDISDTIPGNVIVLQGDEVIPPNHYLSSENETVILTNISDPSDFFSHSFVYYMWYVDNQRLPNAIGPNLTHNFTAGDKVVLVSVTAYHPVLGYREGTFTTVVKARDPIGVINMTGRTILTRGDIFDMEVECGGSPPWSYCWKPVFNENETEAHCDEVMTTNVCEFRIIYFFPQAGRYKMLINISNDVNLKTDLIPVTIFNVLPEPQLSTVIIPVVCSLLAVAIIVVGVFYFIQTRHRFTVEVADFDFTSSDSLTYRTFYGQLKDALYNAMPASTTAVFQRGWNFLDCRVDPDSESLTAAVHEDGLGDSLSSDDSLIPVVDRNAP